jgi:quinol-cytochrome oxidoreductase complex cytochrome b subunit
MAIASIRILNSYNYLELKNGQKPKIPSDIITELMSDGKFFMYLLMVVPYLHKSENQRMEKDRKLANFFTYLIYADIIALTITLLVY